MRRTRSARAPEGIAGGTCRPQRRRGEAPRGKEWIRSYKCAQRELDNAASLVVSSIHTIIHAGRCASRPIRSTRILAAALHQVAVASKQHAEAKRYLVDATEVLGHTPPELRDGDAPELLDLAHERCDKVAHAIHIAVEEVFLGHTEISASVASGEVVPEHPSDDCPRPHRVIVITPRPLFVRAFLAARRQPHAGDRITPVLRRRRRTPAPAEVRVPRRNLRGRAPPLSSACSL